MAHLKKQKGRHESAKTLKNYICRELERDTDRKWIKDKRGRYSYDLTYWLDTERGM